MTHGTLNLSKRSLCCPYVPLTMTAISLFNFFVFSLIWNLISKYLICLKMVTTDILVLFVILYIIIILISRIAHSGPLG